MKHRRSLATALSTLAALTTVLVFPTPATAASQFLGYTAGLTHSTPAPTDSYAYLSKAAYWSVFGILPPSGADYDLSVTGPAGTKASYAGSGLVDFVVVNTNSGCPAAGSYQATVHRYSGSGDYRVGLDTGHTLRMTPGTTAANTVNFQGNFIAVHDVWLTAGVKYVILAPPDRPEHMSLFFLLGSDPTDTSTCMRSRSEAIAKTTESSVGWELTNVTVPRTGWYAAVSVAPDQQGLPVWIRPQV